MRIGWDTETTGLDLYHEATPFFFALTKEDDINNTLFWEWDVDPLTRKVIVPERDLDEIAEEMTRKDITEHILQNAKYDVTGMAKLGLWNRVHLPSVWGKIRDTLRAGHLLASKQLRDLTTLCLVYLGVNIKPWEADLHQACIEARRVAQREFPDWAIAKKVTKGLPSAGSEDGLYKNDYWLPRAVAKALNYSPEHPWWTVLAEYACPDSSVILPLYAVMEKLIKERGLYEIYLETLKLGPIVHRMEEYGITLNGSKASELKEQYLQEASACERICISISEGATTRLSTGVTNEMKTTLFDTFKLVSPSQTDKGNPSLDKDVLEHWMDVLDNKSKPWLYVRKLREFRQRATAASYLTGYERYRLPIGVPDWYRLHPSLKSTGSSTLRFSSANPNEQNISKKEGFNLRSCFGPAPGREWWSLDAKNIELRIPAYEAGETLLIDLFEKPDEPPFYGSNHLLNFSAVYPDLWDKELVEYGLEKVGPACKKKYASTWYQRAKNGWFAIQYGAIDKANGQGTADRAFGRPGSHTRLKSRLGKLEQLNQKQIAYANRYGYVETMPDKTVNPERGYPLQVTMTNYGKALETVPLSYHVQGTAMWWMIKAMNRCDNFLLQWNNVSTGMDFLVNRQLQEMRKLGYHLVMQVHDELVFDFPRGEGSEPWKTNLPVIRRIKELMEQGGSDIGVPTEVSCEYHEHFWDEGRTVDV